jgi:RND family efflux transporter MFP subunit
VALVAVSAAAAAMAIPLSGCKEKAQPVALAPAAVSVSKPLQEKVSDFVEFTGTTEALASVDVRARVKGFLKKVNFTEGSYVKEGDVLFEIEPDIFQATVDRDTAALEAAQALLKKNEADLGIKKEMAAGNAASKLDVIVAEANVNTANAQVAGAKAALKSATIDLGYTKISAPLTGRIDRSRVDVGNLVGADGNTLLANIVSNNPMYVYFDVDEPTVQRFQARMKAQGIDPTDPARAKMPLEMALGDSNEFKFKGVIDFVDNKIDPSTGTIRVRGSLPNADHVLVPGFFARVRIPDGDSYQAVMVPDRSIGVDQGQKYVLVVNDKNVVETRPIEVGSQQGRMRVVKKGLTPDEWIITEGILRTRPGATVAPQQKALMPAPATPAATTNPVASGAGAEASTPPKRS